MDKLGWLEESCIPFSIVVGRENEQVAAYYMVKWFEKNFPVQLEKHKRMKEGPTQ